jgi:hypothetical protein
MHYFSKKKNKDISAKEILQHAKSRKISYVKARCELGIVEIPTPKPKKSYKNISKKDLDLLAWYGINHLKITI